MMKQTLCLVLCVLFLILSTSSSAIRRGKEDPELMNPLVSATSVEEEDSVNKLMGMDDCGEGDEECLKRRMMTEAHLDYIYTQHHKH
ncbi:hypothetical protein CARUB_v10018708mg [Capsella rubella]|uniref:Phytosulfokine n=1 Tax=Capsella rubella TaxID=81985 RepID=R0EU08_9BRAS|nr:putative phytosulfokines 6 [Capsella rubella]XP_006292479.1 putative phytosulfokines 6 [Capsella rubella]EOA12281.1 hypothetical protein CARUB_v10008002mg [Capsella rubella]EOA25377.1 hypothetical protein CARUB_v10018708mg [Capsella rubella]